MRPRKCSIGAPGEPGRLGLRPGPQRSTLPSCRSVGEEHRRALQGGARARQGAALRQFRDAGQSWSRVERIIARVEAGIEGTDTRFIVTSLEGGRAKHLYQRLYCARGQAENHIKAWKNHLAADRTSCHAAEANQFRLFLHAGAYWLLWSMRRVMPKHSVCRGLELLTFSAAPFQHSPRVGGLQNQVSPLIRPRASFFLLT